MFSQCRSPLALLTLALLGASAQAAVVSYQGVQGPKANLSDPAPPTLEMSILNAQSNFTSKVQELGRNEFEQSNALSFDFTGGAATFSGGASRVQGINADPSLGRYNTTPNLDPISGFPNPGNWAESKSDFSISFTGSVTAFSFFITDLGDYDGAVFIDVFGGADNRLLFTQQLVNTTSGEQRIDNTTSTTANGNLLYFGLTSSVADDVFKSVSFRVQQSNQSTDWIGFDSFVVGQYSGPTTNPVPEPGSLALAGLALLAAGYSRRKARQA